MGESVVTRGRRTLATGECSSSSTSRMGEVGGVTHGCPYRELSLAADDQAGRASAPASPQGPCKVRLVWADLDYGRQRAEPRLPGPPLGPQGSCKVSISGGLACRPPLAHLRRTRLEVEA